MGRPSEASSKSESFATVEVTLLLNQLLNNCTGDGRYSVEWSKVKDNGTALQLWKETRQASSPGFLLHGVQDIPATIGELRAFFSPRLTSNFKAMMKLLHGADFVDGEILSSTSTVVNTSRDEIFSTSLWCAFKSKSVLSKDRGFRMNTASQMFCPPHAHIRTFAYLMIPNDSPSFLHQYSSAQWTFGIVVEEMSSNLLRVSCRCTSDDSTLYSLATRVLWNTLRNLPQAISTINHTKGRSLVSQSQWIKDEYRTECIQCHADFTTFRRRHHCRTCGEVVCSSCSSIHVAALARGPMKIRMCSLCLNSDENSRRESQMTHGSSLDGRKSTPDSDSIGLMRIADTIDAARSSLS